MSQVPWKKKTPRKSFYLSCIKGNKGNHVNKRSLSSKIPHETMCGHAKDVSGIKHFY